MEQNKSTPPFLTKTYQIVDDPETDGVVSWGNNGKTFVVWKTDELGNDLLPKHFKHRNFSSFVRQLNTYGFRKVMPDRWEFANNFFQKGKPELISQIRRKTPTLAATSSGKHDSIVSGGGGNELMSTSTSVSLDNSTGNSSHHHHHHHQSQQQPTDITNENVKLRLENELLSCELARTRKQCDGLVAFLTRTLKIGSDHVGRIMHLYGGACNNKNSNHRHDDDDEKDQINDQNSWRTKFVVEEVAQEKEGPCREEEEGTGFKLFGVLLRNCSENEDKSLPNNKKKKRAREENVPVNASVS